MLQAYYQMIDREIRYGIISNYQSTIFLYRPEARNDVLIMSKEYRMKNKEIDLFKFIAWFAQACTSFMKKHDIDNCATVKNVINNIDLYQGYDQLEYAGKGETWGLLVE